MVKGKLDFRVQWKGLDKLTASLTDRAKMELAKQVVRQHTAELQHRAQSLTGQVYDNPTGATKRGIMLELQDGGLTGVVGMTMLYNPYTELGTRFMRARPVLKPAFLYQEVKFINALKSAVK